MIRACLAGDSRSISFPITRFVFVVDVHGRVLVHIMIPVEVVLELVIGVEGFLDTFDRAHETLDDVLDHAVPLPLS